MLEILFAFFGELVFSLLAGSVVEIGFHSLHNSFRPARDANRLFASVGMLALGLASGLVSALLFHERLTPVTAFPGVSLVIAPVAAGLVLEVIGRLMNRNGLEHTALMTWWGGGLFALGVAAGRLVLIGI